LVASGVIFISREELMKHNCNHEHLILHGEKFAILSIFAMTRKKKVPKVNQFFAKCVKMLVRES